MSHYTRNLPNQGSYLSRLWSTLSRVCNVLFFNGSPNESISSRCYRIVYLQESDSHTWAYLAWCANRLFFWEDNHVKNAYYYNLRFSEEFQERHQILITNYIENQKNKDYYLD